MVGYVYALDVSKGKATKVLYKNSQCIEEGLLEFTRKGFEELLQNIRRIPGQVVLAFETTGIYSKPLERFCHENQLTYHSLNPLEVYNRTNSLTLRRNKTDQADAHKLAQIMSIFDFQPSVMKEPLYEEMKRMNAYYLELQEAIDKLYVKFLEAIYLCFPGIEKAFSKLKNEFALTVIEKYPHPDYVLGVSRTVIKNMLKKSTSKNISNQRAFQKADQIIECAVSAYPSVHKDSFYCQVLSFYATHLKKLISQKEVIQDKMITLGSQFSEFTIYSSVPGIGELSACQLIAELGDLSRFKNHKQLNAYVGIDIRRYQSGKYTGQDHINKRGNRKARKILYVVITNMIRSQRHAPNHIVDYYYTKKQPPFNKCHKVAVIACMNKLLKCLYALFNHHTKYDYELNASHRN
ncbi:MULTISPECIES: IS110 family transposase [Aerococcus]|uniref:IS110 family transposase n=2 Tax=Aerococcaceae TaxID=186827 RepID=UPI0018A7D7ED|nr:MULTISPECIES: IS110 family transposase [Aerococcus]MCY3036909.1 IS110 family transposase [Aerococcus sp. Group 2]MCY3040342.1 IS110 family transposase [Aerococcus sp. Group 2]MCY3043757.1 IS110 family transposase [Aerococcus sp. Group 2]MDK6521482.1 IS110 family transposase [Aerococcus urinae]